MAPLATPLQNGEFVQVITAKAAHPSLDWLNFVATPTARNRVRQWYKRSHRDENISRGTEMLEREVGREGFDALLHGEAMAKVAKRCNLVGTEDLLAALGFGGVTLHQVLNRLREEIRLASEAAAPVLDSEAFYADCRQLLSQQGCMAVNLFGRSSSYTRSVEKISAVFGADAVWAFKPTREGNTVVLAQHTPSVPEKDVLLSRSLHIEQHWGLPASKWLRVLSLAATPIGD